MELFMCNHPYFDKQFLAKNFAAVELDLNKAQVKRRSSHAPNLIAALSSTQERRLT